MVMNIFSNTVHKPMPIQCADATDYSVSFEMQHIQQSQFLHGHLLPSHSSPNYIHQYPSLYTPHNSYDASPAEAFQQWQQAHYNDYDTPPLTHSDSSTSLTTLVSRHPSAIHGYDDSPSFATPSFPAHCRVLDEHPVSAKEQRRLSLSPYYVPHHKTKGAPLPATSTEPEAGITQGLGLAMDMSDARKALRAMSCSRVDSHTHYPSQLLPPPHLSLDARQTQNPPVPQSSLPNSEIPGGSSFGWQPNFHFNASVTSPAGHALDRQHAGAAPLSPHTREDSRAYDYFGPAAFSFSTSHTNLRQNTHTVGNFSDFNNFINVPPNSPEQTCSHHLSSIPAVYVSPGLAAPPQDHSIVHMLSSSPYAVRQPWQESSPHTHQASVGSPSIADRDRVRELPAAVTGFPSDWETRSPPESDFELISNAMIPRMQKTRFHGDMYTPKWIRGKSTKKEGWCSLCPNSSWFQLKNSAYWYHKQYIHGVSSTSGYSFVPPLEIREMPGKEASTEGLCHSCMKWVKHSAAKAGSKGPSLWWRHAHKCHSTITSRGPACSEDEN